MNQFKRHLKAPRAKNQIAMNNCFTGTFYNIAERYTNMTKIVFLCGWYAVIFPAGYFFGAAALVVQYYADKFCLLVSAYIRNVLGNWFELDSNSVLIRGLIPAMYCTLANVAYSTSYWCRDQCNWEKIFFPCNASDNVCHWKVR